jgi:integrase
MTDRSTNRGHNEGTIFRTTNDRWRVQVSLPNGKRHSVTFDSKRECEDWLYERRHAPKGSPLHEPEEDRSEQTLAQYIQTWLAYHRNSLKQTTAWDYQRLIEKVIIPGLGSLKLNGLRRSTFDQFYAQLVSEGMGKSHIHYTHRIIHKALADAVDDRILPYNPSDRAKTPRLERTKHQRSPLSLDQVHELLDAVKDSPIGPLIHLAVKTGMRQGELLALQWQDIDWKERQVHVRRNLQRIREDDRLSLNFSTPKSRAGDRIINIGDETIQVLQQQRSAVHLLRTLAGERWQEYKLVFPTSVGTPRHNTNVLKTYKAALKAAGLPTISFHALRHVAASLMLNHGVPVLVVSYILGHSQPSTTMNMYGHEFTTQEIQAAAMMDQLLKSENRNSRILFPVSNERLFVNVKEK